LNKKASIFCYLRGGLGNQLFIYSTARYYQKSCFHGECEIYIDDLTWDSRKINQLPAYHIPQSLHFVDSFRLPAWQEAARLAFNFKFCPDSKHIWEQAMRNRRPMGALGLIRCEDGFVPFSQPKTNSILIDGYFQSEQYFPQMREELLEEFTLTQPMQPANQALYDQIQLEETVCIGIRLGDYQKNQLHDVCTAEYYTKAVMKMRELYPKCKFVLFSNDIPQAKILLDLPEDTFCETGIGSPPEILKVMSACNHFIISNSTFHWWAQYLCQRPGKNVIAPDRWFNGDMPCDIYQNGWILLSADGR